MGEELEKIKGVWLVVAFLFPVIGTCLWVFWRKKYEDSKMLLIWAIVGAVVFTFLRTLGV